MAQLDVTTAENQVAVSQLALVNSQAAVAQQQLQLKNLISRTGPATALIADVEIVPVDQLAIPATDDIPPVKDLVQKALANRSDLLVERGNMKAAEISASARSTDCCLRPECSPAEAPRAWPEPREIVNISRRTALHRRSLFRAAASERRWGRSSGRISPPRASAFSSWLRSTTARRRRITRIDQLSLRQQQLITAKDMNQAQVDVTNSVVALRQARARYDAAVQSRILQQQLLDAEEKKFNLGASTPYDVVVAAARSGRGQCFRTGGAGHVAERAHQPRSDDGRYAGGESHFAHRRREGHNPRRVAVTGDTARGEISHAGIVNLFQAQIDS